MIDVGLARFWPQGWWKIVEFRIGMVPLPVCVVRAALVEGTADPAKKINTSVALFYPNLYFPGTLTVLTYAPK